MKKYICAVLALLMLATIFVGCGKRNVSDHPGGMITDPTEEMPTIIPEPTMTESTMTEPSRVTDPTGSSTKPTEETAMTDPIIGGTDSTNNTDAMDQSTNPSENSRSKGRRTDGRS